MGKLSASILSADLANLAAQVKAIHEHADVIHVDIMDGRYAPRLTVGPVVAASLRPHTDLVLHGHLVAEAPEALLDELADAGVDLVSFPVEAVRDPGPVIAKARGAGLGVGLTLNPETGAEVVSPYLEEIDDVMVMSVHVGRAGEVLLPGALPKLDTLRRELDRRGLPADLEVDGGVTLQNARRCVEAGATVLVAGSAIFGAADAAAAARELKATVEAA